MSRETILIVDDTPDNLALLNGLLKPHYRMRIATGGERALKLAWSDEPPDLILLDIVMPGMDGYEVCQRLRADERTRDVPIIFITAKSDVADEERGLAMGAVDYITKPISPPIVLQRVKNHMELKKHRDRLEELVAARTAELRHSLEENQRLLAASRRFVPAEFLEHLNRRSIVDVQLGDGLQKTMSVLFCDIRRFTTISEAMSPQDLFRFMNAYLTRVAPAIRANQGFIDKYIGDSIMALFDRAPEDAIDAGIRMLQTLRQYNTQRGSDARPSIHVGIGINTGGMMLGTVGEENRMDTTVISDAVNLASRMEGLNKRYGTSLLISENTWRALVDPGRYQVRAVEQVVVKGKTRPVWVYAIYDGEPDEVRALEASTRAAYDQALASYEARDFAAALDGFGDCAGGQAADPVVAMYTERCRRFLESGFDEERDGATLLTVK